MYGTSRLYRFPSSAHLRSPCQHLPPPFFHLPPQTMFISLWFLLFILILLFLILLPPWPPHTPLVQRLLTMVSDTWRACKFFQRPKTWAKHTGKSPGQQSTYFQPYPSSFVIFSCETKTFQTVLSKYGKSFVKNIQRVHLSMVCNT